MSVADRSAKTVTRRSVRAARAGRDPDAATAVETALAAHLDAVLSRAGAPPRAVSGAAPASPPEASQGPGGAGAVAVYRSLPGEPGTGALREGLRRRGYRVLLPVLLPDLDLDWVEDPGPADPEGDPLRPAGARLGGAALSSCVLVLVPALAVDPAGTRLGQGGGSYDRALSRLDVRDRPLVLAVVHDDEVLAGLLPRESHDVRVDGALTPSALVLLPRA